MTDNIHQEEEPLLVPYVVRSVPPYIITALVPNEENAHDILINSEDTRLKTLHNFIIREHPSDIWVGESLAQMLN